jgi:hypothetical protein
LEFVYFTLAGIALYFLSDRVLDGIERMRGKRFAHREIIFFVILLVLALVSFQAIQYFVRR